MTTSPKQLEFQHKMLEFIYDNTTSRVPMKVFWQIEELLLPYIEKSTQNPEKEPND